MLPIMPQRRFLTVLILIGLSFLIRLISIGCNDLLAEEAYYWNYSQHLDLSYLDHPPMVAILIKLFTSIFGTHEFSVRIPSILCWIITAIFSFKLTQLIKPGAGLYAILLLAIMPFFFIHSLIITPDLPLMACWSASLYYLYNALILDNKKAWLCAGIWIGLGMLSKYTIVLLGPATLIYLIIIPSARKWFAKKEPYLCLLITIALFTPVIYWNATHEWVSFVFQGTHRLQAQTSFSFHHLLGLFILFLTPLGVFSFWILFQKTPTEKRILNLNTTRFIQIFTLVPLVVFSIFSLTHSIKFNWIGPGMLAIVPWIAILIDSNDRQRNGWLITGMILLLIYISALVLLISGLSESLNRHVFSKYISWQGVSHNVFNIADEVAQNSKTSPIIVPLDLYNIASELAFYQNEFLTTNKSVNKYTIIGRDIFGRDSLMYRYWSKGQLIKNKTLILVSENPNDFVAGEVLSHVIHQSSVEYFWAHSQHNNTKIRPYYYQIVIYK